jgi:hypothetical protein
LTFEEFFGRPRISKSSSVTSEPLGDDELVRISVLVFAPEMFLGQVHQAPPYSPVTVQKAAGRMTARPIASSARATSWFLEAISTPPAPSPPEANHSTRAFSLGLVELADERRSLSDGRSDGDVVAEQRVLVLGGEPSEEVLARRILAQTDGLVVGRMHDDPGRLVGTGF